MQVRDLLAFAEEGEELEGMDLSKTPTGFSIPGLTKVPVTSAEQVRPPDSPYSCFAPCHCMHAGLNFYQPQFLPAQFLPAPKTSPLARIRWV